MKFVFLIFPFIFLSSCMTYSSGYIPTVKIDFKTTKNLAKNKKDVSFSTSYYQQVGEDILLNDKKLQKSILNSFNKSGLFKRVYYTPLKEKSDYHYHFDVKITGTNPADKYSTGIAGAYMLLIFPTWVNHNVDISMTLFVNGEETYTITAAEKTKDIYWLPFLIFSPFFNHGTVGSHIRKKSMRYFINEIINEKLYEL